MRTNRGWHYWESLRTEPELHSNVKKGKVIGKPIGYAFWPFDLFCVDCLADSIDINVIIDSGNLIINVRWLPLLDSYNNNKPIKLEIKFVGTIFFILKIILTWTKKSHPNCIKNLEKIIIFSVNKQQRGKVLNYTSNF